MNWKIYVRQEKIEPGVQLDLVPDHMCEQSSVSPTLSQDDGLEMELPNHDRIKGVVVELGANEDVIVAAEEQRWRIRPTSNEETPIRPPIEDAISSWIVVTMLAPS